MKKMYKICYMNILLRELFPFHSPMTHYSPESLTHDEESRNPLQDLVEAEAGPEAQVGPEVVEGAHEAEPVHGGDLHPDLSIKDEAERGAEISLGSSSSSWLLYCGHSYQTRRQTVGDESTIKHTVLRK